MSNTTLGSYDTDAFAFETITVSTLAIGFTSTTYQVNGQSAPRRAVFSVAGVPIRYRYDGSDPTITVGHYLAVGTTAEIWGVDNIKDIRFIRDTAAGSDATLSVTYEH